MVIGPRLLIFCAGILFFAVLIRCWMKPKVSIVRVESGFEAAVRKAISLLGGS